jgi:hypothetical protein
MEQFLLRKKTWSPRSFTFNHRPSLGGSQQRAYPITSTCEEGSTVPATMWLRRKTVVASDVTIATTALTPVRLLVAPSCGGIAGRF